MNLQNCQLNQVNIKTNMLLIALTILITNTPLSATTTKFLHFLSNLALYNEIYVWALICQFKHNVHHMDLLLIE